jgi:hypothetical protein
VSLKRFLLWKSFCLHMGKEAILDLTQKWLHEGMSSSSASNYQPSIQQNAMVFSRMVAYTANAVVGIPSWP